MIKLKTSFGLILLFKGNDNHLTCTCWDTGCPLACVVTLCMVVSTEPIAFVTPELTGGVVAIRCNRVAAVHVTSTGVVQNWTLLNYLKQ